MAGISHGSLVPKNPNELDKKSAAQIDEMTENLQPGIESTDEFLKAHPQIMSGVVRAIEEKGKDNAPQNN